MQKSLKKSLYLGLAALSFASVAGATNANAAKKHHSKKTVKTVKKAKPVTYTSSYNLDQSVVYSLNGNNAIYTKPGTVKGARVVASKSDVKSVANSSKGYFMAYGEAKTSKGVHYYKVVSFDHKYRGWVYAGSAKKVDSTTTATDTPKNNVVYLKSNVSNTLWDAPKYSAFKTTKAANNNSGIANDQYTVDKAVKLNREGWTYYHVTNKTNANYTGWVWAGATSEAAPTDNFNAAKDIKVNFTYNGSQVKSSVFHAYDANLRMYNGQPYNANDLNKALFNRTALANYLNPQNASMGWLASQLNGTGYTLAGVKSDLFTTADGNQFNDNTNNNQKLNNVKAGDTVWLDVVKNDQNVASKFTPLQMNNTYTTYGATPITNFYKPSLTGNAAKYFTYANKNDNQNATLNSLASSLIDTTNFDVKNVNNNNLSALEGTTNTTYLDASGVQTVYKSDAQAAAAYKDALDKNAKGDNGLALAQFAGLDTTQNSNYNGGYTGASALYNSNHIKFSKTAPFGQYDVNAFATSDGMHYSATDFNDMKAKAGNYTTSAKGGDPIHFVYFLAKDQTVNGLKAANMGQNVNFYYYAVPVAGNAVNYANNGTTKY
ncbi:hypothetical protein [Apilactobacillus xinyiensis]|uniref:hypothetical protein n=1 Tax=Apilactobacillus xinyiensis TaxID=2841032 RepID=UPI002010B587|nr:hypothetical protein [Apilactobacillus xinyiensis]MCL0330357.1 hypothetical protein [Apilactobacillus xinyiensis]